MYTESILMLLSWPLIIALSYFLVKLAINRFERKRQKLAGGEEK